MAARAWTEQVQQNRHVNRNLGNFTMFQSYKELQTKGNTVMLYLNSLFWNNCIWSYFSEYWKQVLWWSNFETPISKIVLILQSRKQMHHNHSVRHEDITHWMLAGWHLMVYHTGWHEDLFEVWSPVGEH